MKARRRALKRHMVGFETEMLILEDNGAVSSRADNLIERSRTARLKFPVHKDYTHNMVEIASIANVKVSKGAHGWLSTVERLIDLGKRMGIRIYPYGTYFGTHVPLSRTDRYYRMCEDILGPARYRFATGHVHGFHFHYCLPYGTFNRNTSGLKHLFKSRYKEQLLNIYNAIIAIDPAVSNFMESSPFVDGRYLAKDSRLFLYRAMRNGRGDGSVKGLYYDFPLFGKLPRYCQTISDLIMLVQQRYETWKELVEERHPEYLDVVESKHPLQFNWGPLRVNRIGTFEYRGLDMNLPSNMIGTSLLIKYFLHKIRRDDLRVVPSDTGIKEPFRIEGNKMHVPPFAYVNDVLQYKSALSGLADDEVFRYTRNLANMALKEVPIQKDPGISRIRKMLGERKTTSDEILEAVRKSGNSLSEKLDEPFARELALKASDEFEDEVRLLRQAELAIDFEE